MQFAPPPRASYDAHVLTRHYLYMGRVEPVGQFMVWLNEPQTRVVALNGPTRVSLEVGRDADLGGAPRIQIMKTEVVAVDILSPVARQTEQLMPRRVPMTFTTELFTVSGLCPLMADVQPEDALNQLRGNFVAVLQARIQPIVTMRPLAFTESAMLLLNAQHIATYRPD